MQMHMSASLPQSTYTTHAQMQHSVLFADKGPASDALAPPPSPFGPCFLKNKTQPTPQAYLRQRGLFMAQVGNVARLPLLKQYLLLYSSISLPKLAGLLETDEATLRMALACLKKANYW